MATAESAAEAEGVSAMLVGQAHRVAVAFVAGCEVAVEHVEPERLAQGEGRLLRLIQRRNGPSVKFRDDAVPGGIPAAAAEALQRFVNAVERAAFGAADNEQIRRMGYQAEAVFAESL